MSSGWARSCLGAGDGVVAGADHDAVVFDDARSGARLGAVDAGLDVGLGSLDGEAVGTRLAIVEGLLNAVEPDFHETDAGVLGKLDPVDQVVPAVLLKRRAGPEGGRPITAADLQGRLG